MESPLLFFSPTVNYAGQSQFAPGRRFTDKSTGVSHTGRTALAVTVEPGSYKVGTATAGANRCLNMFTFYSFFVFFESNSKFGKTWRVSIIYLFVRWETGLEVQEREWVSKERGNTIMLALLVRVD